MTEIQAAEARVIDAALKQDPPIDWRTIALALKLPRTTYYRRRRLPNDIKARVESEAEGE